MVDTLSRDDAAEHVYVVFDLDGQPVETFTEEDDAYAFADHDETVVTYNKV